MQHHLRPLLTSLVGKTLAHIVVKEGQSPRAQLFLVFTDGTYYEWYADAPIMGTSTVQPGDVETVYRYMPDQTIVAEG